MRGLLLISLVGASACGDPPCPPDPLGDDILPLRVGNIWVYDESGGPLPGTLTKAVVGTEEFAGRDTLVWQTEQTNSSVVKRANWHDDGERRVGVR